MKTEEIVERLKRQQAQQKFRDGVEVFSPRTGTRYRLTHVVGLHKATLVRSTPKVKGKAARRADKKARREKGFI